MLKNSQIANTKTSYFSSMRSSPKAPGILLLDIEATHMEREHYLKKALERKNAYL